MKLFMQRSRIDVRNFFSNSVVLSWNSLNAHDCTEDYGGRFLSARVIAVIACLSVCLSVCLCVCVCVTHASIVN